MCEKNEKVTLWAVIEAPVGAWVGEGEWPLPESDDQDNLLTLTIQAALMSALLKVVKGGERFSLTLFLTNQALTPIDWTFQQDPDLQRLVAESAEVIAWKEWQKDSE